MATTYMALAMVLALGGLAASVGCSSDSSAGSSDISYPKLASYDRSCAVDADCALVAGEGCAACSVAALSTKDAPKYTAALDEALKGPSCQRVISTAAPCSLGAGSVREQAHCEASQCVVLVVTVPADGGADAAPSDASLD